MAAKALFPSGISFLISTELLEHYWPRRERLTVSSPRHFSDRSGGSKKVKEATEKREAWQAAPQQFYFSWHGW